MKPSIHPPIHKDAKVTCTACGAVFTIPSTVKTQQIEICSNCHPVYTGKYRGVTSSGRVEKFQKRMASAQSIKASAKSKRKRLTTREKLEQKAKEAAEKIKAEKNKKALQKRTKAVKEAKKLVKKKDTKDIKDAKGEKRGKAKDGEK